MKTARFLFLMMIAAGWLRGTGFASQSNSASQQTPSQSRETSDSPEGQKDGQVRSEKNKMGAGNSDVGQDSPEHKTKHLTQSRPNQSHAKPAPSHQVCSVKTLATSNLRTQMPENGQGFQQKGSPASTGISNRVGNHHSVPVPPPTVAVNGQQFRNPRDPGARLASSGGPLTATGGTAAINGTNIKRKP